MQLQIILVSAIVVVRLNIGALSHQLGCRKLMMALPEWAEVLSKQYRYRIISLYDQYKLVLFAGFQTEIWNKNATIGQLTNASLIIIPLHRTAQSIPDILSTSRISLQ
jgi:hypothetical protein